MASTTNAKPATAKKPRSDGSKLTDTAIRKAKPTDKAQKLAAGGGLYLLLNPNGSRWWRFDYKHGSKRGTLSMGTYPAITLAAARVKRDEATEQLAAGVNPGHQRKADKAAEKVRAANSFAAVADEWLGKQAGHMAPATLDKARWTFNDLVCPWIGDKPIADITAPDVLALLRRIEERGAHETAHRTKQRCGQVFRYAVATGRASADPTASLRGALTPAKVTHRAAITDAAKVGELLRAIDGYTGSFVVRCALKLAPLVFSRPGELRKAEWAEIDMDGAVWRIPAEKMKMREEHIIPLSPQALALLRELHPLTGTGRYVFPGHRSRHAPLSDAALNAALRRMGFDKDTMTAHGFRAMASSRLNELGWQPDVIERQLAHRERNAVRAAYNRAQYMDERRKMMQAWADYLDRLRTGGDVVEFKRKAV